MFLNMLNVRFLTRLLFRGGSVLLLAAFLSGCAKSGRIAQFSEDPLAALQARHVPYALKARTTLWVHAPRWDIAGSTPASFLIHRPGRMLLTVQGPVGGVLLQAVSDGEAVGAFVPSKKRLLVSSNAEQAMRELTGGALGLDAVLGVLLGSFPLQDPEVLDVSGGGEKFVVRTAAPNDGVLEATISKRRRLIERLDVLGPTGKVRLKVSFEDFRRMGKSVLPDLVRLEVPSLDLQAELRSIDWEEVGRLPEFTLPAPDGVVAEDLIAEIRKTAKAVSEGANEPTESSEQGD